MIAYLDVSVINVVYDYRGVEFVDTNLISGVLPEW